MHSQLLFITCHCITSNPWLLVTTPRFSVSQMWPTLWISRCQSSLTFAERRGKLWIDCHFLRVTRDSNHFHSQPLIYISWHANLFVVVQRMREQCKKKLFTVVLFEQNVDIKVQKRMYHDVIIQHHNIHSPMKQVRQCVNMTLEKTKLLG